MPYEFILYEKKDRVAYITMDRPDVLNALHPPASREMREAFTDFRDDPDVWVAILTGTGDRAFSAGNDLKYHTEHTRPGEAYPEAETNPLGGITRDFTCWKPIIAAINGYALGGGLEVAMACDIIVASEKAQLGLPEPRVGVVAGAGAAHLLPRLVPQNLALGMLLTGGRISAQLALMWGLVNEVVPQDEVMATAERWAQEIVECAPLAVRATKQMVKQGLGRPVDEAMAATYSEYEGAKNSQDYVEGPKAFAEKRKPEWKGA